MSHDHADLWPRIRDRLLEHGIDLGALLEGAEPHEVRAVVIPATVSERVKAADDRPRDQVVMVRLDKETVETLDLWVETGAVASRSAAAALFIREGLELRSQELAELRTALDEVREAKERLRRAADRVLGATDEAEPDDA